MILRFALPGRVARPAGMEYLAENIVTAAVLVKGLLPPGAEPTQLREGPGAKMARFAGIRIVGRPAAQEHK
jgi:hypothetical protein